MSDELENRLGGTFDFYGVDGNCFKLGDAALEAVEDEDDGYRSYLETIRQSDGSGVFPDKPFAIVRVEIDKIPDAFFFEFDGYRLVDVDDGHVWLRVGTDNVNDYYPMFLFTYRPKAPE